MWVADLLAEMFELDRASLTPASNLYADLDIDSIDAVDLAVKLKQLTGKRLQPEVFKTIRTIDDVVNALVALTRHRPRRTPKRRKSVHWNVLTALLTCVYPLAIWLGHGRIEPRWLAGLLLLTVATRLPTLKISGPARWSAVGALMLVGCCRCGECRCCRSSCIRCWSMVRCWPRSARA